MQRLRPSLLDRLLDDPVPAPGGGPVGAARESISLDVLKAGVARDVEALLNTRRPRRDGPAPVQASLLDFGLEDFSALSADSSVDRDRMRDALLLALRLHEPRLKSVEVTLVRDKAQMQRLRFGIRALLVVHPLSEPVSFDAVLQTTTLNYSVSPARRPA